MKAGPKKLSKGATRAGDAGEGDPTLPPQRAFVVQFSGESSVARGVFTGRVEHLSSAHRIRFASDEELLAALLKMLADFGDPA